MKKIVLVLILILLLSCKKSSEENEDCQIEITCEKIIIHDSIDDKKLSFLISYNNTTNKDVILYTNSLYSKPYKNKGFFIENSDNIVPIGQFSPRTSINVKAKSKFKTLYMYGKMFPSWKNIFIKDKSLNSQLKTIKLFYFDNSNNFNKKVIVNVFNSPIEFRKNLNIEEAIFLTEGKINR